MSTRSSHIIAGRPLLVLVATLVIALLVGFSAPAYAAPPDASGTPEPARIQDPATCAECHAEEYDAWQRSAHAQASNASGFLKAWVRSGRLGECLTCHTTGYDTVTGQTGEAGVTCQACHESAGQEHPPATMSVRVSSEACGKCHVNTLKEWQLSGHGRRGVECTACHQSHSQTLRIQPANELCGSCHGRRREDMAHSSHTRANLTCTSCHMPANPAATVTEDIGGVGTVGHTFSVGSQTCAQCHQDEIHGRAREMVGGQVVSTLPGIGIDQESKALQAVRERVRILESENKTLERKAERQRLLTYVGGAFGFGTGAFVGLIGALVLVYVLQRRGTV
jgi:hypothetical protein